jgi:hypothetical protein
MPSTTNNVWASSVPEGEGQWLTTPSGQTCQAKRLGMSGIISTGLLGDADTLTALVDSKHVKRARGGKAQEIDAMSLLTDPEGMKKVVRLVDEATPHIVMDPVVNLHFTIKDDGSTVMIPPSDRKPGDVYTDQIGFEDKMFLFNWSMGGTADADRFLDESGNGVASVEDVPGLPRAAKRAAARNRK